MTKGYNKVLQIDRQCTTLNVNDRIDMLTQLTYKI